MSAVLSSKRCRTHSSQSVSSMSCVELLLDVAGDVSPFVFVTKFGKLTSAVLRPPS